MKKATEKSHRIALARSRQIAEAVMEVTPSDVGMVLLHKVPGGLEVFVHSNLTSAQLGKSGATILALRRAISLIEAAGAGVSEHEHPGTGEPN
jgi:hypothetical protein